MPHIYITNTTLAALQATVRQVARAHDEGSSLATEDVEGLIRATAEITAAVTSDEHTQRNFLSTCPGEIAARLRVQLAGEIEQKEGKRVVGIFRDHIIEFIKANIPSDESGAVCRAVINIKKACDSGDSQKFIQEGYTELMKIIGEEPIYDKDIADRFIVRLNAGELDKVLFENLDRYESWKQKYL